jgi:hypothetical protein
MNYIKKFHFGYRDKRNLIFKNIDHYFQNIKKIIKNLKNKLFLDDFIIFIKIIIFNTE